MDIFIEDFLGVRNLLHLTFLTLSVFQITIEIHFNTGKKGKTNSHSCWRYVMIIVVIVFLLLQIAPYLDCISDKNAHKDDIVRRFKNTRMVFPDSSSRRLDYCDVAEILECTEYSAQFLLNCSLNELYARFGYTFSTIEYACVYQGCTWYKPKDISAEEVVNKMNEVERYNLNFLAEVRRSLFPSK